MTLSDRNKTILAGILITLSTLITYWNLQYNGLIGYDDVKYLIENEYVRSGLSFNSIKWALTATYDANWIPLTWMSHMLDMTMFGSNPLGHHLENLFLHIANSVLLLYILTRLTGHIWRSTAVALIFALHPLHVESVAWIAERKDVLSTLFFLLTIRSYVEYVKRGTKSHYWAAILLYVLGLASKPMLVSLPFVLLLLDFWPLCRVFPGHPNGNDDNSGFTMSRLQEKAPFVLLSIASSITTYIVQRSGGTVNDTATSPILNNSLHAFYNYATYLRMTFLPVDLGAIYPYIHELPISMSIGAVVLILILSLLAFIARRRMPYVATGWFWFLITTAPVVGFVRIGSHSVADRYTYIPSIGIFIVAVWLISDVISRNSNGKVIAIILTIAVTVPLAIATWQQTTYWKDSITLFEHTLSVTKNNWVAHNNLGAELLKSNQNLQATWHIKEAVRIDPEAYPALFNQGVVFNRQGSRREAINSFIKVIKLNPNCVEAYFEAGRACFEIGEKASAYEILTALTRVDKDMADALKRYYVLLEQAPIAIPAAQH